MCRWVAGAAAVIGLAACSSAGDDEGAATAGTVAAGAADTVPVHVGALGGETEGTGATEGGDEADAGGRVVAPAAQVTGQAIAIEAHATVQVNDVRSAVDRLTTILVTRGGRVAAADADYDHYDPGAGDGEVDDVDDVDDSRATLVLSVPPGELPAMSTALQELGTLTSFDQLAEDVTEQLADLDSRIANMRASVERIRALLAEAVDIDGVVRLEAELTSRETELERLLAAQRQLDERVAMATLTVELITSPDVANAAEADDDPGIVDALAAGWDAFTTAVHRVGLVLAASAPFVAAALLGAVALVIRRAIVRNRPPVHPPVAP